MEIAGDIVRRWKLIDEAVDGVKETFDTKWHADKLKSAIYAEQVQLAVDACKESN